MQRVTRHRCRRFHNTPGDPHRCDRYSSALAPPPPGPPPSRAKALHRDPTIAVIGTTPKGLDGVIRFATLADFEQRAGLLERLRPGEHPACHAVCHALMNGAASAVFCGVADLAESAAVADAVTEVLNSQPVGVLVMPGLVGAERVRPAIDAFSAWESDQQDTPATLWLDPPRDASPRQVVEYRNALPGSRRSVRVATPWVSTITPGLRTAEPLPPSCLVGPLFLGMTAHLRGAHELGRPPGADEQTALRAAGCGLLVALGIRRLVRLAFPPPVLTEGAPADAPHSLESRIRSALDEIRFAELDTHRRGKSLWKTVERRAKVVLDRFKSRREILDYRIQCDEETNQGRERSAEVVVWVTVPKRVKQVMIRTSPVDLG